MKVALAIGDIGECRACGAEFVAKGTRQITCGDNKCRSTIMSWQQMNFRNRKKGLPELTLEEFKHKPRPTRQAKIDEDFPNHCAMCGAHIIDSKMVCRLCYNPKIHVDTSVDEVNPIYEEEHLTVDNENEVMV